MNIKTLFLNCAFVLVFNTVAFADAGHHKPYVGSPAFEKMRSLVGEWEGTIDMGQGPQTITTQYRLTSAGSALVETTFDGHPHEMMTIYHDDSKKQLTMVHYCAEHNQPKMTLTKSDGNRIELNLAKDADINVASESHMHAVVIEFTGKDEIVQHWTSYADGKEKAKVTLSFKRKNSM